MDEVKDCRIFRFPKKFKYNFEFLEQISYPTNKLYISDDLLFTYTYANGNKFITNKLCQSMAKFLIQRYPELNKLDLVKMVLKYHNCKNQSGTNWSPIETYLKLPEFLEQGYKTIECFSSPFNNQNVLNGCPVDKPMIDIILTCSKYDRVLPNIEGSFPEGLVDHILSLKSDKVLLLLNPIYTEFYIFESFRVLSELKGDPRLEGISIKALTSLPSWDDIFEDELFLEYTKDLKIDRKNYEYSRMRNIGVDIKKKMDLRVLETTVQ
jgi:hypothetical protein